MSKRGGLLLLALMMIAGFAVASDGTDNEKQTAELSYKAYQKWTIQLPKEQFAPVAGKIAIPHKDGAGFAARIDGSALAVDVNGNGSTFEKARGVGGFVVLKGLTPEGKKFRYAVRLKNEGGWKYATGCAMVGKINGKPVRLIDQNNNGSYADFGEDAMVVGKGNTASFLSKVINVGGDLLSIDVTADGKSISYAPFNGDTGTLNLMKAYNSRGKLAAAVVMSSDGEISFNLAGLKKGMQVPVGSYTIASGMLTKGKETVKIRAGRSKPIGVQTDQESVFEWGGPLKAEFEYTRDGENVTFSPNQLWFYGKGGEEYFDWFPDGQPPKFIIKNAKNGREINTAKFGGC